MCHSSIHMVGLMDGSTQSRSGAWVDEWCLKDQISWPISALPLLTLVMDYNMQKLRARIIRSLWTMVHPQSNGWMIQIYQPYYYGWRAYLQLLQLSFWAGNGPGSCGLHMGLVLDPNWHHVWWRPSDLDPGPQNEGGYILRSCKKKRPESNKGRTRMFRSPW